MDNPAALPQPPPRPGQTDIMPLVVADLEARRQMGIATYGTPLMSHNGRDSLMDAYQEALDLVMYLRQALEEKKEGVRPVSTHLTTCDCDFCRAHVQPVILTAGAEQGGVRVSPSWHVPPRRMVEPGCAVSHEEKPGCATHACVPAAPPVIEDSQGALALRPCPSSDQREMCGSMPAPTPPRLRTAAQAVVNAYWEIYNRAGWQSVCSDAVQTLEVALREETP